MYTSVGLLVLAHALAAPPAPTWNADYAAAQAKAAQARKPLVVVVGSGQDGYHKLSREGKINGEASVLLAEHYVCVYLDLAQSRQATLAKELAIANGQGLVISDRTGALQAFHHDGSLSAEDLNRHLRHFANPAVEVRTTATNGASRISLYPGSTGGPRVTIQNC